MTDSTDQKPTLSNQTTGTHTEDFDLVDLRVIPEQDPAPVPLNHVMEEDILLQAKHDTVQNSFATKDSLMPNGQTVADIKANFYVDYFDKRKKAKKTTSIADVTTTSPINDQATNTMDTNVSDNKDSEPDSQAPIINGSGMAVAILSQFKSKQENINKHQEQLLQDVSGKMKSAKAMSYAAVFLGMAGLVAAGFLGTMLLKTQSQLSDLTGTTTALKDEIRNVKGLPEDLEGTDPALDQLSQKVDQLSQKMASIEQRHEQLAQSKGVRNEKKPVAELIATNEEPVTAAGTTAKTSDKPPVVAATTEKKAATDKPQVIAASTEKKPPDATKATAATAAKPTKTTHTEPTATETVAVNDADKKPAKSAATNNKSSITNIMEKAQNVPPNDINKLVSGTANNQTITTPHTANDTTPAKATSTATNSQGGGWTVTLASSNKPEDAKRTAASFAQKGVPVSINQANTKDGVRYRIQLKGFKTKEEATAAANKAKDTLKLNSYWINP